MANPFCLAVRGAAHSHAKEDGQVCPETRRTLQDVVDSVDDLVDYFYNDTPGSHAVSGEGKIPVPREVTNWRSEQQAWRETAVMFDQTHHMPELYLSGPDARALLTKLGVNSMENLAPGVAKQFACCNPRGQLIADCILYVLGEDSYELVSGKTLLNWVHFHADSGDWNVEVTRDENTSDNPTGRKKYRYQLDGPNAEEIFARVIDGEVPDLKPFRTAPISIGGVDGMVLRHSMSGNLGVELSGPAEHGADVRRALLEAGSDLGLRLAGHRAYFSTAVERGWVGYPLPAIYTHEDMRAFREWLPADGWEARYQLGGSFYSDDIEDYYYTPYDYGYDRLVKFDHDFVGRAALEQLAESSPRTKVTLIWHKADVERVVGSLLGSEVPYKYIDLPLTSYTLPYNDRVLAGDGSGRTIGRALYAAYSYNEQALCSLAVVERAFATPGTEVSFVWGEPDGGSRKAQVERPHRQTEIRATVAPAPFGGSIAALKELEATPA